MIRGASDRVAVDNIIYFVFFLKINFFLNDMHRRGA
jgi:hypothetical protein